MGYGQEALYIENISSSSPLTTIGQTPNWNNVTISSTGTRYTVAPITSKNIPYAGWINAEVFVNEDSTITIEVEYPSRTETSGTMCAVYHGNGVCDWTIKPKKRFTFKLKDALIEEGQYQEIEVTKTERQFIYKSKSN